MKFSGKIANGPMNKRLNFGGNPIRDRIHIVTLVKRALAEVCTVPVLVILNVMDWLSLSIQYGISAIIQWCAVQKVKTTTNFF